MIGVVGARSIPSDRSALVPPPAAAVMHCENSDVLPFGSVAVAVMKFPAPAGNVTALLNEMLPVPSVVTCAVPRKRAPSPNPDASHAVLAKKSRSNVVEAALLRLPPMVLVPAATAA